MMANTSCYRIATICGFFMCFISKGISTHKKNLYVSRESGNDSWSCDRQSKPCKSIWRAVTLASHGDHIYLDGANTSKDPYTCQSKTREHLGIYINKSLSFTGFGPMPQIKCLQGSFLFDGFADDKPMNATLSGLHFKESHLIFQDFSAYIDGCKVEGGQQSIEFVIRTTTFVNIQVTDSTFYRLGGCISVNLPPLRFQDVQITLELKRSSFEASALSDEQGYISLTGSQLHMSQVNCNVILDTVTFTKNNSNQGRLFSLDIENGDQNVYLQNVTLINNSPDPFSNMAILMEKDNNSEFTVNSTNVNIFVNKSKLSSPYARALNVCAEKLSLQIHNSSFIDHRVEGDGGVISLTATQFCKLDVFNSIFTNTISTLNGGAISIKCSQVKVNFYENIFTNTQAKKGNGGAVYINGFGQTWDNLTMDEIDLSHNPQSNQLLRFIRINITKCRFKNAFSSSEGGAVYLKVSNAMSYGDLLLIAEGSHFTGCRSAGNGGALNVFSSSQIQVKVKNSYFVSNDASLNGGALNIEVNENTIANHITIENSTFYKNSALCGGALFIQMNIKSTVRVQRVIMESNVAQIRGGAAIINNIFKLELQQSQFLKNKAGECSAIVTEDANSLEVRDSLFDRNSCFKHRLFAKFGSGAFSVNNGKVASFSIVLTNTTFKNCSAGQGAAIFVRSFSYDRQSDQLLRFIRINITKCHFTNAFSSLLGGAVYVNVSSVMSHGDLLLIAEGSHFTGCRSAGNGGALNVFSSSQIQVKVKNSYFLSNDASLNGGALNIEVNGNTSANHITIENSTFFKNSALYGGAMHLQLNNKSTVRIQRVIMKSNVAQTRGGAAIINNIFKLELQQSRFLKNKAGECSAICADDANSLEVKDSLFDRNSCFKHRLFAKFGSGAFLANSGKVASVSILITNTTFKNCSAGQGAAMFVRHLKGNVSIVVKKSQFVDNLSFGGFGSYIRYGGAIGLLLAPYLPFDSGCAKNVLIVDGKVERHYSQHYKSHVLVEDTIFERNAGEFGGAIHLVSGNATFRNCSFINNFASAHGGHIYTDKGSTSLEIEDSLFSKTINHLQSDMKNFSQASFIHTENAGPLKLYNTTLDSHSYSIHKISLLVIYEGRRIDFGKNNLTAFYCPKGSQLEIPFRVTRKIEINTTCKFKVTTLRYDCVACPLHAYSVQRGSAFGGFLNEDIKQCLPCPFGADCTGNISAKRNFWGFKDHLNPPTLKFAMCPLGYCSPPQKNHFPESQYMYNGCQGNRSGELCGQCNEAYTETLYSTNCKPSHKCKDYWFWPVALIYVSFMAMYFTFRPLVLPWIGRQILWFKKYQPDNTENSFDSGYLKILFYFYQAADLLLISRSSKLVIKTYIIDPFVGFFNFKQNLFFSGSLCPFPGLTVVYKMLFSACHVFGTFLMICVCYASHYGVQRLRGKKSPSPEPYLGGILRTMLLGYSTLGFISFNLLRCVPIGSEKRLFFDGNIVCFQWWQYALIAFICVTFVPFVFVLFWGSFKLYSGSISVGNFIIACCFPFPLLFYWAFVAVFCKVRNTLAHNDSPTSPMSRNSAERVLYDSFKRPEDGRKLSLSWESVMIGRRLILIVLKAFVSDPMPRLLIMSFFCVLFLLHHALTQPFRDSIANIVETISLLCIVILAIVNVFFASFLSLAVPFTDHHFGFWLHICQGLEVVILCSVPIIFGLISAIAFLSQLCRLGVVICRCALKVWRFVCFRSWIYMNQDDKTKPLLAPIN